MPDRYVLSVDSVAKSFGRVEVLKSASLWAEAGRVTTLMGRNGSGKTTLLKVAAGELRPDRGTVSFRGAMHPRPRLSRLARQGLMYLPQELLLAPRYRVRDHFAALSSTFHSASPEAATRECGIEALLSHRVAELSRGERVRTSLALAFARRPLVLLADEPLTGLAPREQERMGRLLRRLASQGTAVVASGHDVRALLDVSDVIVWSTAGTTHQLGAPDEALGQDQFRREYLGGGDRFEG